MCDIILGNATQRGGEATCSLEERARKRKAYEKRHMNRGQEDQRRARDPQVPGCLPGLPRRPPVGHVPHHPRRNLLALQVNTQDFRTTHSLAWGAADCNSTPHCTTTTTHHKQPWGGKNKHHFWRATLVYPCRLTDFNPASSAQGPSLPAPGSSIQTPPPTVDSRASLDLVLDPILDLDLDPRSIPSSLLLAASSLYLCLCFRLPCPT